MREMGSIDKEFIDNFFENSFNIHYGKRYKEWHEQMMSFQLFACYFSNLWSFWHISLYLLVKYFILSDTIVNGTFPLIFFSDHSLLAYRNTTDVCILTLCPENLFNLLVLKVFCVCVEFFRFSLYRIKSSVNRDNFTCFPIWVPFISFSC